MPAVFATCIVAFTDREETMPRAPWSIGRRMTFGFLALVGLSAAGIAVASMAAVSVGDSLREVGELAEAGRRLSRTGALVREFYMHQAHLALGLETHEHVGHTRNARRDLAAALDRLEQSGAAPDGSVNRLRERFDALDQLFEQKFLPAHAAGRHAEAAQAHFAAVDRIQKVVHELERDEAAIAARIAAARAAAVQSTRRASLVATSVVIGALVCALLVATRVTQAVTVPVETLEQAAANVACAPEGARVPETGPPELAALGRSINEMLTDLEAHRRARAGAETMAALGRVAAGIAHEINNPLGVILGHARLIERAGGEVADDAAVIARETRDCQDIVKALLDYARPGALRRDAVDLVELARLVADRHDGCSVDAPDAVVVSGDPARLRQLLSNLVHNGLAFGDAVTIEVEPAAAEGEQGARLTVRDDGPGVPEDALEQVFEPFYSQRPTGSGLGLAIARSIAQAHGGTLRALRESERPGGVFVAWLPAGETNGSHPRR